MGPTTSVAPSRVHQWLKTMGLLLVFAGSLSVNLAVAEPGMVCDKAKYDFGTCIELEQISHEFVLRNCGDIPVKITGIKNCCGISSSIEPMEIPPGSNAVCKVVFNTRNRYGRQNKQIIITTDDRHNPYLSLIMSGALVKPVEFSPRCVRLGSLRSGDAVSKTISVTNLLDHAVVLDSVEVDDAGLNVSVTGSTEKSWIVTLSTSSRLNPGAINAKILMNFSFGTIHVPVLGTSRAD